MNVLISNSIIMMSCGFFLGIVSSMVLYGLIKGVHDNLTNAKVGSVYNFYYHQPLNGTSERFMAKVIGVNKLSKDSISLLNKKSRYRKNDNQFFRTEHLVTAQTPDGRIRNFYAERTTNVRRPILGKLMFKTGLTNLLF